MGIGTEFLENSSICGLAHISKSKTYIEGAYWIVVSVLMIAGTVYLTAVAVDEWEKDPISTITETFPIDMVQFPKGRVQKKEMECSMKGAELNPDSFFFIKN